MALPAFSGCLCVFIHRVFHLQGVYSGTLQVVEMLGLLLPHHIGWQRDHLLARGGLGTQSGSASGVASARLSTTSQFNSESGVLSLLNAHELLHFLCADVFVRYNGWNWNHGYVSLVCACSESSGCV